MLGLTKNLDEVLHRTAQLRDRMPFDPRPYRLRAPVLLRAGLFEAALAEALCSDALSDNFGLEKGQNPITTEAAERVGHALPLDWSSMHEVPDGEQIAFHQHHTQASIQQWRDDARAASETG